MHNYAVMLTLQSLADPFSLTLIELDASQTLQYLNHIKVESIDKNRIIKLFRIYILGNNQSIT